jgi:hypothetical protein
MTLVSTAVSEQRSRRLRGASNVLPAQWSIVFVVGVVEVMSGLMTGQRRGEARLGVVGLGCQQQAPLSHQWSDQRAGWA